MPYFKYVVTVLTDTQEHADQVVSERVNHDEDYGFVYGIEYEIDKREALASVDVSKLKGVSLNTETLDRIYLERSAPETRGNNDPKPSLEAMRRETR